jgi:DNA primase catalytic subunit
MIEPRLGELAMTVNMINTEWKQAEDIFDLDMKELGDHPPSFAVPEPKSTNETCTLSVVCCCCSA